MRTVAEIKQQIERLKQNDFFYTISDLVVFLPFDEVKQFLNPDATKEDWEKNMPQLTDEAVLKKMREYMPFALEKAKGHRGLSANRSIDHFRNWLFLLGDDELLAFAEDDDNYANYGVPILKKICDKYNLPFPDDEGLRNMAQGKPCKPDCESGCGRCFG